MGIVVLLSLRRQIETYWTPSAPTEILEQLRERKINLIFVSCLPLRLLLQLVVPSELDHIIFSLI